MAERWYSSLFVYGLAIAGVFALDAIAFRTGTYRQYLEPESYAGQVEQMLRRASTAAPGAGRVIVLGDSRIAEGFSAKIANQRSTFRFVNASVPGSTPRCWYYFLRWMPPEIRRNATVVIPLDDYQDEDGPWDWADRTLDNSMLAARLPLSELPEYLASFGGVREKMATALNGLFRGSALRQDFQAFLAAPQRRITKAEAFRTGGVQWSYDYTGNPSDLRGLKVDWLHQQITFPATLRQPLRDEIRASAFRNRLPQTGRYRAYRLLWLRRIATMLQGSGGRVIVVRVPRGPVVHPHIRQSPDTAVSALADEGLVSLAPEGLFNSLEQPMYFFDALHMNAAGRLRFTEDLTAYVTSDRKDQS